MSKVKFVGTYGNVILIIKDKVDIHGATFSIHDWVNVVSALNDSKLNKCELP